MKFEEDISRINFPIIAVKIWSRGESDGLRDLIGFGYSNQLFVSKNKKVTLFCDVEEFDDFDKALASKLDESFFSFLCDQYLELIEESEDRNLDSDEIFGLLLKMWPIMCIFHEISLDPQLVSEENLRRLVRVRSTHQNFFYDQLKRIKQEEEPEEYFLFKGKLNEGIPDFTEIK